MGCVNLDKSFHFLNFVCYDVLRNRLVTFLELYFGSAVTDSPVFCIPQLKGKLSDYGKEREF
jgi:hypothetical protein